MTSLFSAKHKSRSTRLLLETLESRLVPANAAFDLIGLTALRANPSTSAFNGSGISVAVIDTGVDYTHTLLSPAIVTKNGVKIGRDFINDTEEGSKQGAFTFFSADNNPEDVLGHGTHVAGIIAARNPDVGVAQGAGIIGLKALDDSGSGSLDDILSALRWVSANADSYNIRVVNMSLGFGFFTQLDEFDPFRIAISDLEAQGITVVSAAGNSFAFSDGIRDSSSPGIASTLNVGATWKDGVNSFTNWGNGAIDYTTGARRITSFSQRPPAGANTLDNEIFAPGAIITSTIPNNGLDPSAPNSLLGDLAGTSMAAPTVAGIVAIMQDAALQLGGRYLSPAEVRQIITSTATSINDGDDEDDSVTNTGANFRFARVDLAVASIQSMFNTPVVNDDPNGAISSAQSLVYDFRSSIVIDGNLGNDGGYDSPEFLGEWFCGLGANSVTPVSDYFAPSGDILVGRKDVDFYRVQVDQPGTFTIQTSDIVSGTNPTINTAIRVFNSAGTQVALNDDSDPFTGGADTVYVVQSKVTVAVTSGLYYIAVSGGQNINYNPNTELSGIDAVDRPAGAPTFSGNGVVPSAQGNYRMRITFDVVDPNGTLAGAEESPVQVGGNLIRRGFLGGDYLTANTPFPRPDQLIVNFDPNQRFGVVVDSNALVTVGNVTKFRNAQNGLPDTSVVRDVDMYITTAPGSGIIALDTDSLGYANVDLGNGTTGSVAADTRIRAWRVEPTGILTPLQDAVDGAFSDDDGRDPSDPNDPSQSATWDSFFQVRVSAGDRILFGVSNWRLDNYDPLTATGREPDTSSSFNRTVGFYDAFLSFRTDDDLNGRIGADVYNLETNATTNTSTKAAPIEPLPVESRLYNIGKDVYSDLTPQERNIGAKDVDMYWFTTNTAGVLFVDIDSTDGSVSSPVETILRAFEITTNVDGTKTSTMIGFSDSTINPLTGVVSLDPSLGINVQPGRQYYIGVSGYNNAGYDEFRYSSGIDAFGQGDYRLESNFVANANVVPEPVIIVPDNNERGQFEFFSGRLGSDSSNNQTNRRVTGVDVDTYEYNATKSGRVVFRVSPGSEFGATPSFQIYGKASGSLTPAPLTSLQTDGVEAVNVVAGTKYTVVITGGRGQISVDSSGKFSSASTRGSTGAYTLSLDEVGTFPVALTAPTSRTFSTGSPLSITGVSLNDPNLTPTSTLTVTATASRGTVTLGTKSGASVSFTGTQAQVNTALAGLKYQTSAFDSNSGSLTLSATSTSGSAAATSIISLSPTERLATKIADPTLAGKTSLLIQGSSGNDSISVTRSGSSFIVSINGVSSTIAGVTGRILVYALSGNDTVDTTLTTVANAIYGGDGNDIVLSGSAADIIFGENGADLLAGGLGADNIQGGFGRDLLFDGSVSPKNGRTLAASLTNWAAAPASPTAAQYDSYASFFNVVRDTGSHDILNGNGDLDLFFAAIASDIVGILATEKIRTV